MVLDDGVGDGGIVWRMDDVCAGMVDGVEEFGDGQFYVQVGVFGVF